MCVIELLVDVKCNNVTLLVDEILRKVGFRSKCRNSIRLEALIQRHIRSEYSFRSRSQIRYRARDVSML